MKSTCRESRLQEPLGLQFERGAQSISSKMVKVSNWVRALGESVIGRSSGNEGQEASFLLIGGGFTRSSQRPAKLTSVAFMGEVGFWGSVLKNGQNSRARTALQKILFRPPLETEKRKRSSII